MKERSGRRGREGNDDPADVCVLELPATLRQIRDHKKISRAKTYRRLDEAATPNYLYELERGLYKPSQTMLDGLVTGYHLNKDQARYLHELSYPSVDLESEEELRRRVTSRAEFSAHLQDMQKRGMPGAYMDPVFNVLMCNDLLRSVLPGLDEAGSILVWMFSSVAKELVVDWERHAPGAIAMTKGVLARYRHTEQAEKVLRKLSHDDDFRRIWVSNIDVVYGRDSTILKYFRVPGSNKVVGYSIRMSEVPETSNLMMLTVVRKQVVESLPDSSE
ncbi:hypothetical protein ACIA8C_10065 [Nocardia sp. NPDC051321]|uniref:MmyB family transcriptional regulator n=1 Tax=Nocardia sp. NPDC051321 TaxID=3364323 RepID=UPI0037A073C2